ncbi:MAG: adenine phosphoribosyltransferase [Candidatus Marsarchaeota archaeon]|jgi:adenine phosphoribosyltransferase|nr:adenine phosphoribosyltransferase [Candidatus Marsarchaeota archaeon]
MDVKNDLRSKIRDIPDYPKPGILFKDITPMLSDAKSFSDCISELCKEVESKVGTIDYVLGIEARGFIIGSALAYKMGVGFIPARKKGKLPYKKISVDYTIEYGKDTIEVHEDSVPKGSRVLIADDLLATGGTAKAAATLVEKLGGTVSGFAFVIWLSQLEGEKLIGSDPIYLIKY